MSFQSVGVVGAGVMGTGLAQDLAQHGIRAVLVDISEEQLENARDGIRQAVRMQALFGKGKKGEKADDVLARVHFTTDTSDLADVDYLVENVTEKWEIKEPVYREIDRIVQPECVFAVNTSCVSITRMGSVTNRPDKVIGMHFMNPVPLKPTVEVIRGDHTSEATIARAHEFLAALDKDGIVVNDMPGFVSNRVLMLTINEAIWLVQDNVATPEDIDSLFTKCFGHKMGPLATGDLIGLDTILYSLEVLYESFNDDKFRPCPLLKKMVWAGKHGRKSGQGFFEYAAGL